MSNNIVSSFSNWQKMEEQEETTSDPGVKKSKEKIRGENGLQSVKVKQKPGGFKVVLNNDAKLTDGTKFTPNGWEELKGYLKSQDTTVGFYNQVKDPKQNKVIYSVKSGGNRQVININIVPASKYPGIAAQAITQEEADKGTSATSDKTTIVNQETSTAKEEPVVKPGIADGVKVDVDTSILKSVGIDPAALPLKQQNGVQDAVKPYQTLIINKIKGTKIADTPIFKRVLHYGADGKYGDITGAATKIIKTGLGYKDKDGSVVDKDWIETLNKQSLNEGYLWYGRIVESFNMEAALAAEKEVRSSVIKTKDSGDTKKAVDTNKSTSDTSKGIDNTKKVDTDKGTGKKLSPKLAAFKTLLGSDQVSQDVKDAIKKYHNIGLTKEGKLYKIKSESQRRLDAANKTKKSGTDYLE